MTDLNININTGKKKKKKKEFDYIRDIDLIKFSKKELQCEGCKRKKVLIFRLRNQIEILDKIVASFRDKDGESTETSRFREGMEEEAKELKKMFGIGSEN